MSKIRAIASFAVFVFIGVGAALPLSAQAPPTPDFIDIVRKCHAAPLDPFRSVAGIKREVDCVSDLVNTGRQPVSKVMSPTLSITSRSGPWDYHYRLNGAVLPKAACVVTGTLVLPQGTPVEIHITSEDTIHAFRLPALGIRMVAVPGRISIAVLRTDEVGTVEAMMIHNENTARERSITTQLSFVSQAAYSEWERKTLRARGCA